MGLEHKKIVRRRKIAGGLVIGGVISVLIGYSAAQMIGGQDELIFPGIETDSAILSLLASRDMGHLPSRDGWCSLVRDAEHCWLLQEASGDATDYGTPGGWHLTPTGTPRQGVPAYVPTADATGDIVWDEKGVSVEGGKYLKEAGVAMCDATTFSLTYVYQPLYADGTDLRLFKHYASGTSTGWLVDSAGAERKQRLCTYSVPAGGTFTATSTDDGAPHCRTISWDRSVDDGVHLYLDGVADGTHDATGDGSIAGTDSFFIGDPSIGGPVLIYRARLDCGVTTDLAEHQTLCGSLYQDPSDAYSENTELADADSSYTQTGGARCFQTEEHAATCIPGDKLGWWWSSTLDASGYGDGYIWALEPGRTNRLLYSSSIDCTDWTCDATPTVTTGQVAPDGSATATEITTTDASKIYTTASGYSNDTVLELMVWIKCSAGIIHLQSDSAYAYGYWIVDCSKIGGDWELLTASHDSVSEATPFHSSATGDSTLMMTSDITGVTASLWMPTLTEKLGLSVIPTEAAAVATGDPAWEIDNSGEDYYKGGRGKLTLVGDWISGSPVPELYDPSYRGESYGDGAEWLIYDDGPHDASSLGAGAYHTCAVKTDGSLACWGWDLYGQATPPAGTDYASVSAGYFHTCAVKTDGSLACWGRDDYGQATPPAGADYASVSGGGYHNCTIKTDGSLACWGRDNLGQSTPPAGTDYASLAAGYYHNCTIKTDGSLACWGYDVYGQATPPAGTDYASVSAGYFHTCAIKTDGSLACWGWDNYGQATPPAGTDYASVSGGGYHTCAIKTDGSLACWGRDDCGQATPPAGADYASVSGGGYHTCAIKTDGSLACWGDDYGQCKVSSIVAQCNFDADSALPWVLQWDSASFISGASRHVVCTLGGIEQAYTVDATGPWTHGTPDTIKLWRDDTVGGLYELKIESKP